MAAPRGDAPTVPSATASAAELRRVYALNDAGNREVITANSIQRQVDRGTTEEERRVLRRVHAVGHDLRDMMGHSMIFVRASRGDHKRAAHFRSEATERSALGRTVSVRGVSRPISDVHLEAQQWLLAHIGRLRVRSYEACEASDTGHIRAVWHAPPGTTVTLEESRRHDGRAVRFDVVARAPDGHETVIEVRFTHKTNADARPEGTLEVDAVCIVQGFATPGLVYVDNLMRMRGPCPQCHRARCVLRRWTPALVAWRRRAQERLEGYRRERLRALRLAQERRREAAERLRLAQEKALRWNRALEVVRTCVRQRAQRRAAQEQARARALELRQLAAAVRSELAQCKSLPWSSDAKKLENQLYQRMVHRNTVCPAGDWSYVLSIVRAWIKEYLELVAAREREWERRREKERETQRRVERSKEVIRRHVCRRVSAIRARKRAERQAREAAAALEALRRKPARVHTVPKKRGGVFATGGMKQSKLTF